MNDEETKILNHEDSKGLQNHKNKKMKSYEKTAYAGGGFVAGVAVGVGGNAFASDSGEEMPPVEAVAEDESQKVETSEVKVEETAEAKPQEPVQQNVQPAPDPEEILLATDEGIKVGQVNDSASFGEAFADARAQVGPGGVFEWRGQVYSTYYEEEWNQMSPAERADFHSKIDYSAVMGNETSTANNVTDNTTHTDANVHTAAVNETHVADSTEEVPADAEMVDQNDSLNEIKVLGVEAVVDAEGNQGTIAGIEVDGEQALLVDVDNNGTMDVIAADVNGNGQLDEGEVQDISEANIETDDLRQMMENQQYGDAYCASNDDMPDYVNDADVSSLA